MKFFDKINYLRKKISEVENNIYSGKQDFLEIYERNLQLEKEIAERTYELNVANRRMLTLQHIWEMMNSAKPLTNVLETIVNSIQGELGYIHCTIMQKLTDDSGEEYMSVLAEADDETMRRVDEVLKTPIRMRKLAFTKNSIFEKAINQKEIIQSKDIAASLKAIIPDIPQDVMDKILEDKSVKSIITIPIYIRDKAFGVFGVFSSRENLAKSETDFLSMFAGQIEMAVTVADLFEAIKKQAVTDGLTGLYNRRYFEEYLAKEVTRSQRNGQPFSIIGLDLDFLKKINDTYGHAYGDIAIKTVANVLKSNARSIDTAARMGGEEFNIILPGISSEGAMIAAERIRKTIAETPLDTIGHVTASVGVATFLENSDNIEELMELTDQAMYDSKMNGRNRVTLAKNASEMSWQEVAVNTFTDILSKHNMPIPQSLSDDLCQKLKKNQSQKDILYTVADILTLTYNPLHEKGVIKSKLLTAVSLAKRFDLPKGEIDKLKIAILLYDIGNLMLPKELLQKKTPLTTEEINHIKEHPLIAAKEILQPISYIQDVIPIIEHHHENWDGSGYPANIKHEEIPLTSQIILIVDSYFALTEERPYRNKLSTKDALEIIKQDAGKKWNQTLVNEFVTLIEHDMN